MCNISQNENSKTAKGEPPCVKCGYCCHQAICIHGEDDGHGMCLFLEIENIQLGTFNCMNRNRIMEIEKNSPTPMFDHYCSSPMYNEFRDQVITAMEEEKEEEND